MTAGWPASALDAFSREFVLRGLGNLLLSLADEFPGYEFGTQRTWNGVSLVAVNRDGADQAGIYIVITPDLGEMRHLLTHESDAVSACCTGTSEDTVIAANEGTSWPVS
jgi:hypothetical protein